MSDCKKDYIVTVLVSGCSCSQDSYMRPANDPWTAASDVAAGLLAASPSHKGLYKMEVREEGVATTNTYFVEVAKEVVVENIIEIEPPEEQELEHAVDESGVVDEQNFRDKNS